MRLPVVCIAIAIMLPEDASAQRARKPISLPGFTAAGVAAPSFDLPGFTATGVAAHSFDLPGFSATGTNRPPIDLPGFSATGVLPVETAMVGFRATGVPPGSTSDATKQSVLPALPTPLNPLASPAMAAGSFQVLIPSGPRSGKATFCSLPTMDGMLTVYLEGDGITGMIAGTKAQIGSATYSVDAEDPDSFKIEVVQSAPAFAGYPGASGELRITSWTKKLLVGKFAIAGQVKDAAGLEQQHSVSGSFSATPLGGC